MGNKIFVSYKFADNDVAPLEGVYHFQQTTVRDYVDELERYFDNTTHIYKGESNDEDLSALSEDAIWERLKPRIFDSSVTIVMISPGMKEPYRSDKSQWIPWEISYSLKEMTRHDFTSHTNAMLAIVLPDRNGHYEYFIEDLHCGSCSCRRLMTDRLFKILMRNMFNQKVKEPKYCSRGLNVYSGESSYILSVKWGEFYRNPNPYIQRAIAIRDNANSYNIVKEVDP